MSKKTEMAEVEGSVFNLDDKSAIFTMDDGGWVELETVPKDQAKDFHKQCSKVTTKYVKVEGTPFKDKEENFDNDLWVKLFWSVAFKGWGKLFCDKAKTKPIIFTPENIVKMMQIPRFAVFVNESYQKLFNDEVEAKKEGAGN